MAIWRHWLQQEVVWRHSPNVAVDYWKNYLANKIMLSKYMFFRVFQTSGEISYGWQWIIGHTIIVLSGNSDAERMDQIHECVQSLDKQYFWPYLLRMKNDEPTID